MWYCRVVVVYITITWAGACMYDIIITMYSLSGVKFTVTNTYRHASSYIATTFSWLTIETF